MTDTEEKGIIGCFVYRLEDEVDEYATTTSLLTKPILLAKYYNEAAFAEQSFTDDVTDDNDDNGDKEEGSSDDQTRMASIESFLHRTLAENPPDPVATLDHLGGMKVVRGPFPSKKTYQLVYGGDSLDACLVVVTSLSYPAKCSMELLQELYRYLKREVSEALLMGKEESSELTEKVIPVCSALMRKYGDLELLLRMQREREERAASERFQNDPFSLAEEECETEPLTPFNIDQAHLDFVDQREALQRRVDRLRFIRRWTFRCCMIGVVVAVVIPIVFALLRQKEIYEEHIEKLEEEFLQELEHGELPFPEADEGNTGWRSK